MLVDFGWRRLTSSGRESVIVVSRVILVVLWLASTLGCAIDIWKDGHAISASSNHRGVYGLMTHLRCQSLFDGSRRNRSRLNIGRSSLSCNPGYRIRHTGSQNLRIHRRCHRFLFHHICSCWLSLSYAPLESARHPTIARRSPLLDCGLPEGEQPSTHRIRGGEQLIIEPTVDSLIFALFIGIVETSEHFDRGDVPSRIINHPFRAVLDKVLQEGQSLYDKRKQV